MIYGFWLVARGPVFGLELELLHPCKGTDYLSIFALMRKLVLDASSDALRLELLVCEPATEAIGTVQIVHGMCEHKERYAAFMEWLAQRGFVAVCYDQRGHGQAALDSGELGFMRAGGWRALVEDCRVVAEWVEEQYKGLPHNLFGHSMGSMVVRSFAKRYDGMIDALFVCGCPSDNPAKGAGLLLARAAGLLMGQKSRPKLLQAISFGQFNSRFRAEKLPCAWVCSDRKVVKEYLADPLCAYQFTSNGFASLFGLMADCYSSDSWVVSKPALPIAFLSGGDDPCAVSPKALEAAVKHLGAVGYEAVALKVYPGMRHEVLNELGKEAVWEDVLDLLASVS